MITIDQAIDTINKLSPAEMDIMTDLLIKRKIESERENIAIQAEISLQEYYAGLYTPKTANEAIKELEESIYGDD